MSSLTEQDKNDNVMRLLNEATSRYESLLTISDEAEKLLQMDLLYIEYLNPIFKCLNYNYDVQLINIERFGRNDGSNKPMYVPMYMNKDKVTKISRNGFPYKMTALLKLLMGFSPAAEHERVSDYFN